MASDRRELSELLRPAVESLGFELVGVEYRPQGRSHLLRVYIDSEDGISVDDCADVSYQVSGVLDVEDPIPGEYILEVSSPGLDRPLFGPRDFDRYAGRRARIRLRRPLESRRNFSGELRGMSADEVVLRLEDGAEVRLPVADIDQARLIPEL